MDFLISALAGLLCASLNNLDRTKAIQPQFSFANQVLKDRSEMEPMPQQKN